MHSLKPGEQTHSSLHLFAAFGVVCSSSLTMQPCSVSGSLMQLLEQMTVKRATIRPVLVELGWFCQQAVINGYILPHSSFGSIITFASFGHLRALDLNYFDFFDMSSILQQNYYSKNLKTFHSGKKPQLIVNIAQVKLQNLSSSKLTEK